MRISSDRPRFGSTRLFAAALLALAGVAGALAVSTLALPETAPAGWEEVERLVGEQKLREALARAGALTDAARAGGDSEEWTRGLVEQVRLRLALGEVEGAVRELSAVPWPEGGEAAAVLRLFRAEALRQFLGRHGWEIEQREASGEPGEAANLAHAAWLGRATAAELTAAARADFLAVWSERAAWGDRPLGALAAYIDQNGYPARIRGTLRDTVTYLGVELFADSALWTPAESAAVWRLDLATLIDPPAEAATATVADEAAHPLSRTAAVLADLESWHRAARRPEAAFEARRERLSRLSVWVAAADRLRLRDALAASLDELGKRWRWWSFGMATLAEQWQSDEAPDALVRARDAAQAGAEAHPSSLGGRRCAVLVAELEAPAFRLESMAADGERRRSLRVTHKNQPQLHFRAWKLDLVRQVETAVDSNRLADPRRVEELLKTPAQVAWSVELPATPDLREHATYVEPNLAGPGLWIVAASARPNFAEQGNQRQAVALLLTDLVLLSRPDAGGWEVSVVDGAQGRPRAGVEVGLYRADWGKAGHRRVATATTGGDGRARFERQEETGRYFVLARQGNDAAIAGDLPSFWHEDPERAFDSALVFTDRSVYRPGQKVLWKAIAYRGLGAPGRFATQPGAALTLELRDANGEVVETLKATTNAYGTASGEVSIPAGRLLGSWGLYVADRGGATFLVEEYKRPTFEVTLAEPTAALRINRPAELTGEARYLFGLPVAAGSVFWTVTREPVMPPWWSWGGWRGGWVGNESGEPLAAGEAALAADGTFRVAFTPLADERSAASGITYRFRLEADVTDAAGETRSGSRSFRLGFVTVETAIEAEAGFVRAGESARFSLVRRDLDGQPRAGQGSWRLMAVAAPAKAVPPADLPLAEPGPTAPPVPLPIRRSASSSLPGSSSPSAAPEEPFRTPGDLLRPRWDPAYDPRTAMAAWPDGPELRHGKLAHGADGAASLELKGLKPGVYRLRYATVDAFGAPFETATEILVAGSEPLALPLPALLVAEHATVPAGETARWLVGSGLPGQRLELEIHRDFRLAERREVATGGMRVVEIPVRPEDRGGFGVAVTGVADHQLLRLEAPVFVPWDDRELAVSFATFRDRLRPGQQETWRVTVKAKTGELLAAGAAEVLASMYDRSLDLFAPYEPPNPLDLYPRRDGVGQVQASLGPAPTIWASAEGFGVGSEFKPPPDGDALRLYDAYGIGGPGRRNLMFKVQGVDTLARAAPVEGGLVVVSGNAPVVDTSSTTAGASFSGGGPAAAPPPPAEIRTDFAETAFWHPHLITAKDGSVSFEFTVPDAVTEWSVWAHALTRDLAAGSANRRTRTIKELIVRPILPRFLREGDRAELAVAVQNASSGPLSGRLQFDLLDPASEASRAADFGLPAERREVAFTVAPGGSETFTFPVTAPRGVGEVAVRAVGRAGEWSDGELRPLPLLPGRAYLAQSRFAALSGSDREVLAFDLLAAQAGAEADPTLVHDRLVVSVDGQLFYGVLAALPYLVEFPHECTEQTFNRFYSAALVAGVFEGHPAVAAMAQKLAAERDTRLPAWEREDPNRRIALEETSWIAESRGREPGRPDFDPALIKVLDPQVAAAHRASALAALEEAQTAAGGFPWWPGGPPSPYMTLYLLHGFSRALEAGVEVDRGMVERAWRYLHGYYVDEIAVRLREEGCCVETVTFLNYVLSAYPDASWTGGVFSEADREAMLAHSLARWREHSPFLKGYLALTLHRAGRTDEARQVFAAVMDSAKTDPDLGTYWAPEERSWLWYNDTIESHAFALRVLLELAPDEPRRHGLVQWLFLNRQLNHWKSTRATAEVLHAVVRYLQREGALGVREEVRVAAGPRRETFVFEPEEYTGGTARLVIPGAEVTPAMAEVTVEKDTPGLAFAGATWHFSTENPPAEGDREGLFAVSRRYFKRERAPGGSDWRLVPLAPGVTVVPGDQVEVQLTVTARHAAEYVHLRDPRPAGFEPDTPTSGYRWDLGLGRYEEVRDSATNVFFEQLPAGTYTLKLRLRAAHAGTFKAAPATLQSMYAPEFTAHSGGGEVVVGR